MICPDCHACRPCPCDSADYRADKQARAYAAKHGERIPLTTDGRICGGNLERHDRGNPVELVYRLRGEIQGRRSMRLFLEEIQFRLAAALDARRAGERAEQEIPGLWRDEKILRMFLEGAEQADISRAFGKRSHSWANEHIARLSEVAMRGEEREATHANVRLCARDGCGQVVLRMSTTGRPAKYHNDKCKNMARDAAKVERRRRLSVTLSVTERDADRMGQEARP